MPAVSSRAVTRLPAIHALLAILEEEGVEYIFGVPGGPLTAVFEALQERSKIKFVMAKHEGGAAFMAASYARVSRKLGVVCGTSGPGATNALTGVASAHADSVPVLLLTGQVATTAFGTGAIQESSVFGLDLVSLFRPVTKLSAMFPSVERVPDVIRHGIRTALAGRPGAVHLNMPANMLQAEIDFTPLEPHRYRSTNQILDIDAATDLGERLRRAEAPCFLAGHGVAISGAESELLEVARAVGAHILTTPKGKGVIAETDSLWAGVHGFGGHRKAEETVEDSDLLVIVGSSLNEFVTNGRPIVLGPGAQVAQIDVDPTMIGRNLPVDAAVVGDAKTVLSEILRQLSDRPSMSSSSRPPPIVEPTIVRRESDYPTRSTNSPYMKPRELITELRRVMADEDLLFVDIGTTILWTVHHFQVRSPHTFFVDLGLGSMGSAVAGSIGGALASKKGRAVALVGDGAFAMNGFEVHTAVEFGLPIVWVVLNNGGHGMVRQGDQIMRGRDLGASQFELPLDTATIARGLGADGYNANNAVQFAEMFGLALRSGRPAVIDVAVGLDETPPTLRRRVETLARYMGKKPVGPDED